MATRKPKLDSFTRSYMKTALWSSTDNSRDDGGDPLDKNYNITDIADETEALMIEDCALFQERYADLLSKSGIDDEKAGHLFWLNREGHGTGFWDEDSIDEEFQEKLSVAAESFGGFDLYVGDDGEIYGPPADWYRSHRTGGAAVAEAGRRHGTVKWNQTENGNVHVTDGQEGYWASFPTNVTAKKALDQFMSTADYSSATRSFTVTATVLSGRHKGDVASTIYEVGGKVAETGQRVVRASETVRVKLTAYNTGFTDEADFDAWVSYVNDHIDDVVGFPVEVDAFAFTGRGAGGDRDEITGATDEQREAIHEALAHSLWDDACANNFGQPVVETSRRRGRREPPIVAGPRRRPAMHAPSREPHVKVTGHGDYVVYYEQGERGDKWIYREHFPTLTAARSRAQSLSSSQGHWTTVMKHGVEVASFPPSRTGEPPSLRERPMRPIPTRPTVRASRPLPRRR